MAETHVKATVDIHLVKSIPAGAGLGGGSSDCAAVLRVLPFLLRRRVAQRRLAEIALGLGADVPFFLEGRPAMASGVGEVLTPVEHFPRLALVVVVPPVRVGTAWAYATALSGLTSATPENTRALRSRLASESVVKKLHNDFEVGVGAVFRDVPRLVAALRRVGARGTVMTGTGSAVVGIFESFARARQAVGAFVSPDRAFAVRVLRRRPAAVWL